MKDYNSQNSNFTQLDLTLEPFKTFTLFIKEPFKIIKEPFKTFIIFIKEKFKKFIKVPFRIFIIFTKATSIIVIDFNNYFV